jgi:hypothetical protein
MTDLPLTSLYSREENWLRAASEIGATYFRGDFWEPESIKATIPPWTVVLTLVKDDPHIACTRLTARYFCPDSFTFSIFRAGMFADDGHLQEAEEIEIGDPLFDALFRVAGQPTEQVERLLANEAIRGYLIAEPQIGLYAEPVPSSRRRVDLTCTVLGVIDEPRRVIALFELMGETLQHLCAIGSADEAPVP